MITTIATIAGAIGGLSALIVSFLYYRENKNRKVAETKAIEITSLTKTIEQLERDRDTMREEIDFLKNSLRVSDAEKITIERDLNIHKRAIGCRVNCPVTVCPIENKIKELNNK